MNDEQESANVHRSSFIVHRFDHMIKISTLDQLPLSRGARVFYRVDYNVPLEGARITDATRIEETLPTLRMLRERGAAIVHRQSPRASEGAAQREVFAQAGAREAGGADRPRRAVGR